MKLVAVTLKIYFFQSFQNEQKYYSKPLNFPDFFFTTTNCQLSIFHLKWFKDCSPTIHPQIPSLSKHRARIDIWWGVKPRRACLGLHMKLLKIKTSSFRDPRAGNNSFTLRSLPLQERYCIHSFIHSSVQSFIHLPSTYS